MRLAGQPITERLLWAIAVVTVCPHHDAPLHQRCPHPACRCTSPILSPNLRPGYCPSCGGWLGSLIPWETTRTAPVARDVDSVAISHTSSLGQEDYTPWTARRIAQEVGALLARSPVPPDLHNDGDDRGDTLVPNGNISPFAAALGVLTAPYKCVHAFACQVGVPDSTINRWRKGRMPPTLRQLLLVASRLEVSLRAVLEGDLTSLAGAFDPARSASDRSRSATTIHANSPKSIYPRRPRHAFDAEQVEKALCAALVRDEPPPLRTVGRELGYSNAYLRQYFPNLCDAIVARWHTYRARRNRERLDRSVGAIQDAARMLHVEGLYPSAVRVLAMAPVPLRLTEAECHTAWEAEIPPPWRIRDDYQ